MPDSMNFPKNICEFLQNYCFFDKEQIYTNGAALITIHRVYQALEHYAPELLGEDN